MVCMRTWVEGEPYVLLGMWQGVWKGHVFHIHATAAQTFHWCQCLLCVAVWTCTKQTFVCVRVPLSYLHITYRYVWEKSGSVIDVSTSPRLRLDPDGTLHISQTWSGDIGTYTCRVTSVGGNDSRSAHVRVRSASFPPLSYLALFFSL